MSEGGSPNLVENGGLIEQDGKRQLVRDRLRVVFFAQFMHLAFEHHGFLGLVSGLLYTK